MTWLFYTILACIVWTLTRHVVYRIIFAPSQRRRMPVPRSHSHDELCDISGEIRAETERAFRFYNGSRSEWVPKSMVEWDSESKTMTMPQWLAMEKGFV